MILNLVSQAIRATLAGVDPTALSIFSKTVAAYDFDGGAPGFLLDSKKTYTLTNSGVAQVAGGVSGTDATFDSSSDRLTQASNDLDFLTGDFTIGGWFYFPSGDSGAAVNCGLISKYRITGNQRQYSLLREAGVLKFAVSTDGTNITAVAQEPSHVPSAGYYFVLAWRDTAAGKIFLQVNNGTVREATFSGTAALFNGASDLTLGRLEDTGTIYANNNGYRMDCIILADQVLTPAERTWLYNGGAGRSFTSVRALAGNPDPFFANVTALLHFDGTNGSTAFTDVTGRTWTAQNSADIRTDTAKFGSASGWFRNTPGSGSELGSRITTPDSPELRFGTEDFTVEGWFIPQAPLLGFGAFFRKGQNTSGGLTLAVTPTQLALRADSVTDTNVAVSLSTSEWSHIAFTREAGLVRFFVNGVLVGSATRTFNHTDTEALFIGSVAGDTRFAYNGRIDDLRVTKGVARYTENFIPPAEPFPDNGSPSLSALLHFDGAGGSTDFIDVAGKAWTRAGNAQISTAQSKFGVASMLLDGTGDYIFSPSNPDFSFGFGDFTVEWWAYQIAEKTVSWIDFRGGVDNSPRLMVYNIGGSRNCIVYVAGAAKITSSTNVINFGVWQHFAVCRASGTTRLFIDGVSRGSFTDDNFYTAADWNIGRNTITTARDFNGYIDEFQAWKGLARYTSNFTPPARAFGEEPVVSSLMHFDGADGSTDFIDESGKVWTRTANAQISTTQSQFGGSSLRIAPGDTLETPASSDFAFSNGDFTVEVFVNFSDLAAPNRDFITWGPNWDIYAGGNVLLVWNGTTNIINGGAVLATNTWYHIAVTRANGAVRLFLNGNQIGGTATDHTKFDAAPVYMGFYPPNLRRFNGYIDELRITKGLARYTSNFTAPTAPFPDP